jgi:hypothetical protein
MRAPPSILPKSRNVKQKALLISWRPIEPPLAGSLPPPRATHALAIDERRGDHEFESALRSEAEPELPERRHRRLRARTGFAAAAMRQPPDGKMPQFFSRSGEEIAVPAAFLPATLALTVAMNCVVCTSSHYLRPPRPPTGEEAEPPSHEAARAPREPLAETANTAPAMNAS